jgi:hypothetical protein
MAILEHLRQPAASVNLAASNAAWLGDRQSLQLQPLFDVYANIDRRDLGGVGSAVERSWTRLRRSSKDVARPEGASDNDAELIPGLGSV